MDSSQILAADASSFSWANTVGQSIHPGNFVAPDLFPVPTLQNLISTQPESDWSDSPRQSSMNILATQKNRESTSSFLEFEYIPSLPKKYSPRCYAHGCGGRRFSSHGNYRRHLKEQNGFAKSFTCETCGKSFTRSTARKEHQKIHIRPGAKITPKVIPTSTLKKGRATSDSIATVNENFLTSTIEYLQAQNIQETQFSLAYIGWPVVSNHYDYPRGISGTMVSNKYNDLLGTPGAY